MRKSKDSSSRQPNCQILTASSPPHTVQRRTPWRGGRNQHYYATTTTEPQMWARRVNLKLKSLSRDGRFQQVTMAPGCGFAHCVFFFPLVFFCSTARASGFSGTPSPSHVLICRRYGRVKQEHAHRGPGGPMGSGGKIHRRRHKLSHTKAGAHTHTHTHMRCAALQSPYTSRWLRPFAAQPVRVLFLLNHVPRAGLFPEIKAGAPRPEIGPGKLEG